VSLAPVQFAALPPPIIRGDPESTWPVPVRGEAERAGAESIRRPVPSSDSARTEEERRDRQEREMLGRLRVALAEPQEQRQSNVMRRGSYGSPYRAPADLLEQRISEMLGQTGGVRRVDESA